MTERESHIDHLDAVKRATAMLKEFNILFHVAQHASDPHTKAVRFRSSMAILASLKQLLAKHPGISLTGIDQIEAAAKKIEGEIFDARMSMDSNTALWVYQAAFFLNTPLAHLHHHGVMVTCSRENLPTVFPVGGRSSWSLVVPTFRELGIEIDIPPSDVISDIGPIPSHGEPFFSFLILFREIIESGLPQSEIEFALNVLSGRDEFTAAVFAELGPATHMIRRANYGPVGSQ